MPEKPPLPESLTGYPVHLVGIKGTGMTALAEVLSARGARVTGSDTTEKFYTDAVLGRLGIPYVEGFSAENLPKDARLVVHSAAYRREENPELVEAAARGVPMLLYPEALGLLSERSLSIGISGVHGKSTTTAMCGTILKEWGFPSTVIVGAEVPAFGSRSTLVQGQRYLVAETCEYRRHFLNFHPAHVLITSVEPDHLDYFRDLEDMLDAFEEYGRRLAPEGTLVFCADDPGAVEAARRIAAARPDVRMLPYGRQANGAFRVVGESRGLGCSRFRLGGFDAAFKVRVPGGHNVLNAAAALAAVNLLWKVERGESLMDLSAAAKALESFTGSRRRSEIVGEGGGILVMDDYGHHPTAIKKTLEGIRDFYPDRRLVVDFMSHTYSRTQALLPQFATCFAAADLVVLHKIYASAREKNEGGITGKDLFREVSKNHAAVSYFEEPMDALPFLVSELKSGDLFLTMGAGDNWKLGRELLRRSGGAQ
jgi:UDP-N-acetylmuramate--alanine ligase